MIQYSRHMSDTPERYYKVVYERDAPTFLKKGVEQEGERE